MADKQGKPWWSNLPKSRVVEDAQLRIEMHLPQGGPPTDVASITLGDAASGMQLGRFTLSLDDLARMVVGDRQVVMRGDLLTGDAVGLVAWHLRLRLHNVQPAYRDSLVRTRGLDSHPGPNTWAVVGNLLQPLVDCGWCIDLDGSARSQGNGDDPLRLMARCWLPAGKQPKLPKLGDMSSNVDLEGAPWTR